MTFFFRIVMITYVLSMGTQAEHLKVVKKSTTLQPGLHEEQQNSPFPYHREESKKIKKGNVSISHVSQDFKPPPSYALDTHNP
eukprot:jgi/Mesen1/4467/ME000228S03433